MSLLVDIHKKCGDFLLNVQLEAEGEIVGLLGESGSGKSMTLRCIAGIVTPDSGKIVLNGRTLYDAEKKINLTPRARNVGLMFQSYALFPHMTVEQNIASGVLEKTRRASKTAFYLDLLRLGGLEKRYPRQLSGGQQQRVALARMMASDPEILMLDEPFSALDGHLRSEIEPEFIKAIDAFSGTVLYVSHSISEVYRYCSKTAMMSQGTIAETGNTQTLFAHPATLAGARLLCCKNISQVSLDGDAMVASQWRIALPMLECTHVGIFGDDVRLENTPQEGYFPVTLEAVHERSRHVVLEVKVSGAAEAVSVSCTRAAAAALLADTGSDVLYIKLPHDKILLLHDHLL